MAEKKTTKTASPVKTTAELQTELQKKRTELLEAKRAHAAGELVNPRIITTTRKEIARLLTAINAEVPGQKESN